MHPLSNCTEAEPWQTSTGRCEGPELSTCNCDWGCPCQFNARPTQGHCRAAVGMRIDRGHFGDVRLDGLHWVSLLAWPGAIHEGDGEVLAIVDERADERQRDAILTILAGEETEPGATIFNVLAATLATVHKPQFRPIEFEVDLARRTGRFAVPERRGGASRADPQSRHRRAAPGAPRPAARLRVHRGRVREQHDHGERRDRARLGAGGTAISRCCT